MKRCSFRWSLCLALFSTLPLCAAEPVNCSLQLKDLSGQVRIAFQHTDGGSGEQYIYQLMVAGLALFDYDGDGLTDIYFLNGAPPRNTQSAESPANALYRNNGNWTFTDVTLEAGVDDRGHGLGVTVGDYDNDGDPDVYLNNAGPNVLYQNEGDGTFREVSEQAGVVCGDRVGAGTCFLDMDGDGDLDLYVANYVDFSYQRHETVAAASFPYPPGPSDYPAVADVLYRNNGDGTFTDVSDLSGIGQLAGPSMGMTCLDYDLDGDTDIFVCNDGAANYLFQNNGDGRFAEQGLPSGTAYNLYGEANGSMGVDCGDFDNDGRVDMFMTDYTSESPVLYRNHAAGFFEDATNVAGAGSVVFAETNWGSGLVDLDNDGDRDLFIACGHFLINIPEIDQRARYRAPNCLLMNLGDGTFRDVSKESGDGLAPVESSRGAGFEDLDNDGRVDLVILNANAAPTILRNESDTAHRWLQLTLHGVTSNRDGVGSHVRVMAGDSVQCAEVHSGRGYQSHFGTRLHFGLGTKQRVDRVEIDWLGGRSEVFVEVPTNGCVSFVQGTGKSLDDESNDE